MITCGSVGQTVVNVNCGCGCGDSGTGGGTGGGGTGGGGTGGGGTGGGGIDPFPPPNLAPPSKFPPGSGAGGAAGTGDTLTILPTCVQIDDISRDFGSPGYAFLQYDFHSALIATLNATGKFNSAIDQLVSVRLSVMGLAYSGFESGVGTIPLIGGIRLAKFIQFNNIEVPWPNTIESIGGSFGGIIRIGYFAYNYGGVVDLVVNPANPETGAILLDGEFPRPGIWTDDNPKSKRDPAWDKVCIIGFVSHKKAENGLPLCSVQNPFHAIPENPEQMAGGTFNPATGNYEGGQVETRRGIAVKIGSILNWSFVPIGNTGFVDIVVLDPNGYTTVQQHYDLAVQGPSGSTPILTRGCAFLVTGSGSGGGRTFLLTRS